MKQVKVNESYEIFQIITDFAEPLEIFREAFQNAFDEDATKVFCHIYEIKKVTAKELIIDIWNNGNGLDPNLCSCFFDLANSSKVNNKLVRNPAKIGYKGHGAKIFFNAEKVIICSKINNSEWAAEMEDPLKQIENKGIIEYMDGLKPKDVGLEIPSNWDQGFFVRIVNHKHFNSINTLYKLYHEVIRDYSRWFTVFGTINTLFDQNLKDKGICLYLHGLNFHSFNKTYSNISIIDPQPQYSHENNNDYEVIPLGHYFPEKRVKDKELKNYAKKVKSNKPYHQFYSNLIESKTYSCFNNVKFNFVLSIEGYETKRMYDILLTRRGKPRKKTNHTDSERYGFWACKDGIPVQKVDEWIEGGKGTYSFIKAFIDCDDFKLTANRGSIQNTDIEIINGLKEQINTIFSRIQNSTDYKERIEIERSESLKASVEEDKKNLSQRYKMSNKRSRIILPRGQRQIIEPTKLKLGYSESETMVLLIKLLSKYPDLFKFDLLDYNTTNGIDFVVEHQGFPKYIELKGTLQKSVNHPFQHIFKFICYDVNLKDGDIITDIEDQLACLAVNTNDKFSSNDSKFDKKKFTSYNLVPQSPTVVTSMEVICLKSILHEVIKAKFI